MKHFSYSYCVAALALSLMMPAAVSAQNKIGYINMDDLIAGMRETKQARQALKAYTDSLTRIDIGLQRAFAVKRDAFFRDSARMDTATKEAQRRVLQELIAQEGGFKGAAKMQLDSMQQVLGAAVMAKAQDAIVTTAKAKVYGYVFRKVASSGNSDFIIIGPDADDLLPEVRKTLGLDALP